MTAKIPVYGIIVLSVQKWIRHLDA